MIAPYGTWKSPISARSVGAGSLRLGAVALDGPDAYWLEGRPAEGGRNVLMKRGADGAIAEVTPPAMNVRTRVHEYGGGAYLIADGQVVFSEFSDQRLYSIKNGDIRPLTPVGPWRYADGDLHPSGGWMVWVREDHSRVSQEPENTLVRVMLGGGSTAPQVLVAGEDFYAAPRFSADGTRLLWLSWRHPQMPWDGTELWVADVLPGGGTARHRRVAGSDRESVMHPEWSTDGTIYFVSDRSGWWNLYRQRADESSPAEAICPMAADFGRPLWQLGTTTWSFAGTSLVVSYAMDGRWRLAVLDPASRTLRTLAPDIEPGAMVVANSMWVACVASSPTATDAVVCIDLSTGAVDTVRSAAAETVDVSYLSVPQTIEFPTQQDVTARAFYYPPRHPHCRAADDERPPLIVVSHGGPTGAASAALSLALQFWTTRGFAVVDVDYGGSTGYGRAYRQRLNGRWGEVDVDDCVAAARHLVGLGLADAARLIIRGSSAGGYTALAALAFRPDVFSAAASYFGVSDLESLARDTHKFEARYLDTLVGPYPAAKDRYRARSPIHAVDRLSCPLILLQGAEDPVVPPAQAQTMADAVRAKGLPVALVMFQGEQHGFRQAASTVRSLEAELAFYAAVFDFAPADDLAPLAIDNLDRWRLRART
ncbi:MAG: prolyl oligopeptidase family serine peptidase [Vicinamibacterales bacterium]